MFQSTSDGALATTVSRAELPQLWIGALGVALLGGTVLFDAMPGINWALFATAATVAFAWIRARGGGVTPLPVCRSIVLVNLLAASAAVTGDGFLHFLIMLAVAVLAAQVVLACTRDEPGPANPLQFAIAPLRAAPPLFRELHARLEASIAGIGAADSLPAVRGIAIALPVALAFFLLLAGADATFEYWRDSAWSSLVDLSALPRVAFTGVLLALLLGALGLAAHPAPRADTRSASPPPASPPSANTPAARFADIERAIVLAPVAALFAAFLVLRLPELFGDAAARAGSGVTYAQSVHEGFVQMTLAAALCATLLLVLERRAIRGRHAPRIRILGFVLIAESMLLLASAWYRVELYEAAYGYTAFRLYVHVAVVLVAIGLALLARELQQGIDLARLTQRCGTVAALAIIALSLWNHAAWVASRNIERYRATGALDTRYLLDALGVDAVPALVDAASSVPEPLSAEIRSGLAMRYGVPWAVRSLAADGIEWNLRRARARAALLRAGIVTPVGVGVGAEAPRDER